METNLFKTILVPTDFSEEAQKAIDYGLLLAQKLQINIILLHAFHLNIMIDMNGQSYSTSEMSKELEEINAEKLASTLASLKRQYPHIRIDSIQSMGLLVDVVKEICENQQIDLVVMGTKGASGIEEYILGTNTALVVEGVQCPVLVVPSKNVVGDFKKILYATDFLFEDIENIKQVSTLAKVFNATLQVVHITQNTIDEKYVQKWFIDICEDQCDYDSLSFKSIPRQHDTMTTLNSLIDHDKIDLVVMNSSGKNFIKRMFSGSLTQKMTYHTKIPFLAYHKTTHLHK